MGFRVTNIFVKGKTASEIQSLLGLEATGESESVPESPVAAAVLPSGWYLLYCNEHPSDENRVVSLSDGAEVIQLTVNETVMACDAVCWRDGDEVWSITHDAQLGKPDVESSGMLPAEFVGIHARLKKSSEEDPEVDYLFDIPVEVVYALTGFRHDGNPDGYAVEIFEVLRFSRKAAPWWKIW